MAKKRTDRTGIQLGTNAFFQNIGADTPEESVQPPEPEAVAPPPPPPPPPKPKKMRTTITMYPETMALLEALKIDAKRNGAKATFSDILKEAIHDLATKREITL